MAISQNDKQDSLRKVTQAHDALEDGDHATGLRLANEVLDVDVDNAKALYLAAMALFKSGRNGLAYNLFRRACQLQPDRAEPWNMAGTCLEKMWKIEAAERCFKEALKKDPRNHAAIQNMSLICLNKCEPDEALKWCARAEKLNIASWENLDNKAMALLMKRDWSGWEPYRQTAGKTKPRQLRAYNDPEEPMWSGEPGTVVVYGNQGIGDEIAFASCVPDACEKAEIIIDCDHRLAGLFSRSFPKAKVYGTRFKSERDWDHPIDYSIPVDCLPGIFRKKDSDFPGTSYLKADPERRIQWRALFDTFKKPVIGVAWTGGGDHTGRKKRSLSLEDLLPVFHSVDATWVSLEYRDVSAELEDFELEHGIKIRDFPRATRQSEFADYDDTGALVSELDLVVSVTTSVVHLAGGLGKECWCIAPHKARWWYGMEGDLPWYRSVKMFRQAKDGKWPLDEITKKLRLRYGDFNVHGVTERLRELAGQVGSR
jgi:tetratricopeptide (TPR) repeat protein